MRRVLLQPFLLSAKNKYIPKKAPPYKALGVLIFCLIVCCALYFISFKVIRYFHSQNELGIILSLKIFQMAWIIFFVMLVFSCMVSAVSTLFLSKDNEIVFAAPSPPAALYFMRYWTTTVYTGWMTTIFSFPIFAAYGRVFKAGPMYWPLLSICLPATVCTATALGMLATIILVNLFPARRTKDIVLYLSLCFGIFIYIIFRMLRPEDMVNPDKFGHFIDYLSNISTPAAPYLPAAWSANLLSLYLTDREIDLLLLTLTIITPSVLFFLGEGAMHYFFFRGVSKAQESFGGFHRFRRKRCCTTSIRRSIFNKETKIFLRDSAEWSQLFMIAALVVVYLYNFKMLPVDRAYFKEEYITNLISFLNIGLTGFIVSSLAARFVYPSISAEGGAFYIIQTAPIAMGRFLMAKFLFYAFPFTLLSLLLVIVSDHLLKISGPMWYFSIAASTLITLTVVAMALGFGALYADFKAENRAVTLGDLGAVLFLLSAIAFELIIIATGAYPIYRVVKNWILGIDSSAPHLILLGGWFLFAVIFSFLIARHFFRQAIKRLQVTTE